MGHFLEVLIQEVHQYNMHTDTHALNGDVHGECLSIWKRVKQNAIQHLDSDSNIKSPPVKLKHNSMQHSLMELPKSKSAQRKILRRSSSASSAQQAKAKPRTNYWGIGGMFQGVHASSWTPFQKTSTGFKKAKDESRRQGTGSTPIPTRTPNMSASDHANENQFFTSEDKEKPGIVGQSGVKYNFEQSVDFVRDNMSDKSMHQRITMRNGMNYPVTISLSNHTPKYDKLMAILGDNKSVKELIKRAQTSQWNFTISGMHFLN